MVTTRVGADLDFKSFYRLWFCHYYLLISATLGFFVELLYLFENYIITVDTPLFGKVASFRTVLLKIIKLNKPLVISCSAYARTQDSSYTLKFNFEVLVPLDGIVSQHLL